LNSSTIVTTIVQPPELRYLNGGSAIAELTVSFPLLKTPDEPAIVKAIAWGKLAENITSQDLQVGEQVVLESRISIVVSESDGIKHKKAELNIQRYYLVNGSIYAPIQSATGTEQGQNAAPVAVPQATTVTPVSQLATPKAKAATKAAPKAAPVEDYEPSYDDIPF
jgi:single-stranded DNA-binding protein